MCCGVNEVLDLAVLRADKVCVLQRRVLGKAIQIASSLTQLDDNCAAGFCL